jgi:hypothetical protein
VAIAVAFNPVAGDRFAGIPAGMLPNLQLELQPGREYWHSAWAVDDLMKLYLTETMPERWQVQPADVWLEIRGARGEFQFERLHPAEFLFRRSITEGKSIGEAADLALDAAPDFDPGKALAALIINESIVACHEEF